MFCRCLNDPDEKEPNCNICPVCVAHPGTLPVINGAAVKHILKMGIAVGGALADFTEFDRKNYFYPDIPKGYQISQYQFPLVRGGKLHDVELTRVHLEEDTARSYHKEDYSLIDFNRAGVPLMELVTEPVIHTAKEAGDFARSLQLLLRTLGAGEANMEKGQMRIEANISVGLPALHAHAGQAGKGAVLGTKVEVKNLNSFRSVERAIEYEIARQIKMLENGKKVIQETRGWDEANQKTFSQRIKEESHDYRYFPDPDLPKLYLSEIPELPHENLSRELVELPWKRKERYLALGLKTEDANMFVREPLLGSFFDAVYQLSPEVTQLAANYLSSDIAGKIQAGELHTSWFQIPQNATRFSALMLMGKAGMLSSRGMKDTLALMFTDERDPDTIADEKGLLQQSDTGTLSAIVVEVIATNPSVAADYRAGKETSLQYLIGQGMRISKGAANPGVLRQLLMEHLK